MRVEFRRTENAGDGTAAGFSGTDSCGERWLARWIVRSPGYCSVDGGSDSLPRQTEWGAGGGKEDEVLGTRAPLSSVQRAFLQLKARLGITRPVRLAHSALYRCLCDRLAAAVV